MIFYTYFHSQLKTPVKFKTSSMATLASVLDHEFFVGYSLGSTVIALIFSVLVVGVKGILGFSKE